MAKVTVLMPTYNVAPFVKEAIDSVLQQTYRDFELLVIDDCSTDNTIERVHNFHDPRIRIVQNEKNVGLAENLNRGLALIDTEYVARMDGDDIAEPFWLEREIGILDTHPDIGICSAGFERFGTTATQVRFPEQHEDCLSNMLFECSVIVPTFRMSLYRNHGLRYRTDAFPAEDYQFWAECLRVTKIYNLQETLFRYRMHPQQICSVHHEIQRRKVTEVQLYMLEWLSPDFSEEEKAYYTGAFMEPLITSLKDLSERQAFCKKMMAQNRSVGHFEEKALCRRLKKHLTITLYNTIVERYFSHGYSLPRYWRYLTSGIALRTGLRYESKLLLKSLMRRNIAVGEIWMLHRVVEQRSDNPAQRELEVTPDWIEQKIMEYRRDGYTFVSIDDIMSFPVSNSKSQRFVCITFDDGYHDNYTLAYPLLKRLGVPFTVYVTSGFINNQSPMWWYPDQSLGISTDELRQLDADPLCTIGAHTVTHPHLDNLNPEQQRQEISNSLHHLEQLLGHPIHHFSLPHGDYNTDNLTICQNIGIASVVTSWGGPLRRGVSYYPLPRVNMIQP